MATFRCAHIKGNGSRCQAFPMRNEQWCYGHHPRLGEVRAENGRRGGRRAGRGRGSAEVGAIREQLRELVALVRSGEVDRGDAAVCGQLLGTSLRAIEVGRKLQEQEDLLQRLTELEERAALVGGGRRA
ncbi:MAG: hypothetical protein M3P49_03290 [Actinomycetota bacterium]|nr:hypothetical protein [Actinomycetota bacterium]